MCPVSSSIYFIHSMFVLDLGHIVINDCVMYLLHFILWWKQVDGRIIIIIEQCVRIVCT